MANRQTIIKLRRDIINNYASHPNHVPERGEVCIVDPTATSPWARAINLRFKIGDGHTAWKDLPFIDEEMQSVLCGYYVKGHFYLDSAHTKEVTKFDWRMIYIDLVKGIIYYYDKENHVLKANTMEIPDATASQPGIMKLYQKFGQNTDGTMSQKAITDAFNAIALTADEADEESFYLSKPKMN